MKPLAGGSTWIGSSGDVAKAAVSGCYLGGDVTHVHGAPLCGPCGYLGAGLDMSVPTSLVLTFIVALLQRHGDYWFSCESFMMSCYLLVCRSLPLFVF